MVASGIPNCTGLFLSFPKVCLCALYESSRKTTSVTAQFTARSPARVECALTNDGATPLLVLGFMSNWWNRRS
jgi:hypothetical protein